MKIYVCETKNQEEVGSQTTNPNINMVQKIRTTNRKWAKKWPSPLHLELKAKK